MAISEVFFGEANKLKRSPVPPTVGLGSGLQNQCSASKSNIEPIFKYQLNSIPTSRQDFNPYYFGIHSGRSFKFRLVFSWLGLLYQ